MGRYSNNIKEIFMNDCDFHCCDHDHAISDWNDVREELSNLDDDDNNDNKIHIFHLCSKKLERVSIRNVKYCSYSDEVSIPIPQNALIKFVRNVPSLRWFRSDLSQNNIDMLQKERPEIEFL